MICVIYFNRIVCLVLKLKGRVVKCKGLHEEENFFMGEAWQAYMAVVNICLYPSLFLQRVAGSPTIIHESYLTY